MSTYHEEGTEHGDTSRAVTGPADLANRGVGGSGDVVVSRTNPELKPEGGGLPDRRQWYRGRRRMSPYVQSHETNGRRSGMQ